MLWDDVVQLACEGGDPEMPQWLDRLLPVSFDGTTLTCATKLKWTERRVMTNYRELIEHSIHEITMEPIALAVIVDPGYFADAPAAPVTTSGAVLAGATAPQASPSVAPVAPSATSVAPPSSTATVETPRVGIVAPPAPTHAGSAAPAGESSPSATAPAASAAATMSAAALAGAQAATSRTTHPLVNLRAKIPASAQAAMAAAQASVPPVQADIPFAQVGTQLEPAAQSPVAPAAGASAARQVGPGVDASADTQAAAGAAIPGTTTPDGPEIASPISTKPTSPEPTQVAPAAPTGTASPQQAAAPLADATFDTFVVGEANRLAYDAARSVAEEEEPPYNPLFLYSKPGMGKTHLLHAIRNYVQMYRPGVRVRYVTTGDLTDTYTSDLKAGKRGEEILSGCRQADILLVDDVQFLRNKKETQGAFFDIFNQLTMQGKAVVLTADEPPDYLELMDRLKQRFGSGLVMDISSPSHELKLEILKRYAETFRHQTVRMCTVRLPEDALDYMAELSPNSIREMLGFLKRVMMEQASPSAPPLTHERIKEVRDTLFKARRRVDIDTIIDVACEEFDVASADIKGKGRTKLVSEARQVTMWLARQLTDASYQAIGAPFGRDHSTVYTSISKIDNLSQTDPTYLNRLEQLKKKIEARTAQ